MFKQKLYKEFEGSYF